MDVGVLMALFELLDATMLEASQRATSFSGAGTNLDPFGSCPVHRSQTWVCIDPPEELAQIQTAVPHLGGGLRGDQKLALLVILQETLVRLIEGPCFENHWLLLRLAQTVPADAIRCSLNGDESKSNVFGHLKTHTATPLDHIGQPGVVFRCFPTVPTYARRSPLCG